VIDIGLPFVIPHGWSPVPSFVPSTLTQGIFSMINTSITEDRVMDTATELSADNRIEQDRAIIQQSRDEIAAAVGTALRDAGLNYPVYLYIPRSGDALVTLATPVDPPQR